VQENRNSTAFLTSMEARSPWRQRARFGLRLAAAMALVVLVVSERSLLGSSFRALGHLKWIWLVLGVDLEVLSLASFARMQCRLLNAGTARARLLPVMATTFAGNAVSGTVPVAGTQMSLLFVFRRFKKMGVDATVAGWTLVVGGVISSLASALIFALGAILTGNVVLAVTGAAGGTVGLVLFALATLALRRPAMRAALRRPAGWVVGRTGRVLGRPVHDPQAAMASMAARLSSLRLPPSGWALVLVVAVANWLADAGVLAASIVAVGAPVPWRGLLFAYAVGTVAQSVGILPGGLGVVEGALAISLMGAGVHHPVALAAVLVYRVISFWLVISVGWLVYFFSARTGREASWGVRTTP
jgi:uncharacterized protein (TIRG00374 family)